MDNKIKNTQNQEFEIPKSGSLGLLALGYRGIVAWRKVRDGIAPPNSTLKK